MLSFQVFLPSPPFTCHQLTSLHLLSLGSYSTPLTIPHLHSFSKYSVNPHSKFTNQEKVQGKDNVFVVIKGQGRFDGKMVGEGVAIRNPVEVGAGEKGFEMVRIGLEQNKGEQEKKQGEETIIKTVKWSVLKYDLKQGEQKTLNLHNQRVFMFVNKGEITLEGKIRPLLETEGVFVWGGGKIKAGKQSQIIVVQLRE